MTAVAICRAAEYQYRAILHCPNCKGRRRFVCRDAFWYGFTATCCGCGDAWTDGERHPRPFRRGWRIEAITKARGDWENLTAFDKTTHGDWLREQMADIVPDAEGGDGS